MRKLAFVCVLLFGAMGVLAGVPKDVLVIGIKHAAIIDFEPARVYEIEGSFVLEQLYDTLVDFEGGGVEAFQRVSPGLAESWEVSADGYTWIFHLRRGARFHSGREVKADAVVFSLRRALELDKPPIWILKQFVNSPDDIKALDDYTVSITMNQKIGEMLMGAVLGFQGICSIVDPEEVKAHATADDPWATQWLGEHDAGSGPYKLVEWVRNDRIVLEAFADYWGGVPRIKRVVLKDIPEPANQMLLLLKGDIDVAWNLLPDQIAELKRKKGVKFVSTPTFIFYYAAMNMGMEPFNHEEVRDAIRYAIN
ncbi:ABC transporter substrate-binding protein, partial [Thermococci archaeon]